MTFLITFFFVCKTLEQSFCMIMVMNIECQTFKNGETGVISNPNYGPDFHDIPHFILTLKKDPGTELLYDYGDRSGRNRETPVSMASKFEGFLLEFP